MTECRSLTSASTCRSTADVATRPLPGHSLPGLPHVQADQNVFAFLLQRTVQEGSDYIPESGWMVLEHEESKEGDARRRRVGERKYAHFNQSLT